MFECAYRYRFYPTPDQAAFLSRTFGCVRVVYNRARAAREAAWVERKESAGFIQTNALLTAWKKDPDLAWLNEVSSVPLQQALRHLDTAYRNFFRKTARYPGFRRKDGTQSAEFTKSGFNYRDGRLKLAKMDMPIDVVWSRDLPSDPTTVTVIRETDGRWYISLKVIVPTEKLTGGGEVGIDLGLTDLAIFSTGEKIANPRHLAKRQERLAREQRRMAKKQKGSKNRAKARLKVGRAYAAVHHARQDFLHQLSTRLIRENQAIYVEDLAVARMLKSKRMSRSIADAGWGELRRMLAYKAAWYGRTLVKIDRWYPSTKTCSACGTTGHVLTLADREWTCPDCGDHHDRDVNAALNILRAGQARLACGETVSRFGTSVSTLVSVKQEPALRNSGIRPL
jgi:putative transposase